jgi:hypothetical protein
MIAAITAFFGKFKYVFDIAAIGGLIAALAVGIHHYDAGQRAIGAADIQKRWDAAEKLRAENEAKATKQLQTTIDAQRSQTNAQITTLNTSLASAIAGLRDRPTRPDVPNPTSSGTGCTGAQLFRGDAEFLAGEAARADRLQVRLDACYSAYDKAREAVNGSKP